MEKTLNEKFKEYLENSICEILNITLEQYFDLHLDGAKRALENNKKYKPYFAKTSKFWDYFLSRVNYVNFQIITAQKFDSLNNMNEPYTASLYLELISDNFTLPARTVKLLNLQYSMQFDKTSDLQQPKRRNNKRVLKSQNDLFTDNLNTI